MIRKYGLKERYVYMRAIGLLLFGILFVCILTIVLGCESTEQAKSRPATEDAARQGRPAIDLHPILEMQLKPPIGQLRAIPVHLGEGEPKAILLIYSSDAEIDPYIGMFFFPESTLKLMLFDEKGKTLWRRDLGPGVVPGIWFCPVFSFDLDQDGADEIWLVNNNDPAHPLDYRQYCLERINGATGESMGRWPWPRVKSGQTMSHTHRNFILGGYVRDKPVLVTAQGTYGPMQFQGWNSDMSRRWELQIGADSPGARGSHVCPVVDINHDGADEFMWGERCIEMDSGKELFCCDKETWNAHSDIVLPVLDYSQRRWYIHTCREQHTDVAPRIACFDDRGGKVWAALEQGHIDTGWAARIGENGEPIVLGVRVGKKTRSAEGEFRMNVEEFTYRAFSGAEYPLSFSVYTSIPVDLNGDGIHELVKGYFEGDGTVLDREGRVIGNVGGLCAMASKFTSHPGEQILSFSRNGEVRIWADRNAKDSAAAMRRYRHRFYEVNHRLTACGYNLFNLGGI
ncbi:MAG: hypothetical protein JSU70_03140 [Phycisphaerales bacterium]|nr:MAG: hypothetical protein JSU70_03140 [Phycisphaerales bacterium]